MILKSTKIKKKRQEVVLKRKQKSRVKGGQGAVSWEDGALRWGWGESCTKAAEAFLQGSRVVGFSEALMLGNTGGELRNVSCQHGGGSSSPQCWQKTNKQKLFCGDLSFFCCCFWGFFVFVFLKEKYSEDTKQTLVRGHLLLTSQGDQMARSSVTLKSVTPLAAL